MRSRLGSLSYSSRTRSSDPPTVDERLVTDACTATGGPDTVGHVVPLEVDDVKRWPRPANDSCRSCGRPATSLLYICRSPHMPDDEVLAALRAHPVRQTSTACDWHWVDCLNELLDQVDEAVEVTGVRVVDLMMPESSPA